jgi:LmbE family N-acetylglucosaminyl deacetylase
MNLFLSPHCDDAVLSCGALMAHKRMAGERVLIVSLCTASPPQSPLSSFALREQGAWGVSTDDIYACRRAEDQAAAALLAVELIQVGELDAIYRQDSQGNCFYTSVLDLFGVIHPDDSSLAVQVQNRLASVLAAFIPATIYAPLAVGNHVDHQRTRQLAECWQRQGQRVLFYEDYPYVEDEGALWQVLNQPTDGVWKRHPQVVSAIAAEAKVKAIACYPSQIAALFKNERLMEKRVLYQMARTGKLQLTEVVWEFLVRY